MKREDEAVRRSGSASCLHARAGVSLKKKIEIDRCFLKKHRTERPRRQKSSTSNVVGKTPSSSGYTHTRLVHEVLQGLVLSSR